MHTTNRKRIYCVLLLFPFIVLYTQRTGTLIRRDEYERTGTYSRKEEKYDVLVSSYMRGGSSVAGNALGRRYDTMYLYEPFLNENLTWWYWHGTNTLCRTDKQNCSSSYYGSYDKALGYLRGFYNCQFDENTPFRPVYTYRTNGRSERKAASCINPDKKECFTEILRRVCRNAKHRVAKVFRLTTDLLSDLLRDQENLKVVHLFRDPRAVFNSRLHTDWYPNRGKMNIIGNAGSLCNKMLHDFKEGKKLQNVYPDRFRFIFYEDLIERPFEKLKLIYTYLGMDINGSNFPQLQKAFSTDINQTQEEQYLDYAFRWRKLLSLKTVKIIDSVCMDILNELGYRHFETSRELKNLSIRSVFIPKKYLII